MVTKAILVGDLNADCAILRKQDKFPIGHSSQISAILTGPVEDKEQVIVDFSKAKKALKALIDGIGPDHRLIVAHTITSGDTASDASVENTPLPWSGNLPKDGVLNVNVPEGATLAMVLKQSLEDMVKSVSKMADMSMIDEQEFASNHPELVDAIAVLSTVDIEWQVGEEQQLLAPFDLGAVSRTFRYIHGLPNSSSWGCQMPIHGHLSVLQIRPNFMVDENMLLDWLPSHIHFIDRTSIIEDGAAPDTETTVRYATQQRGEFVLTYDQKDETMRVAAPTDTTIENIAEWFAIQMRARFGELGFKGKTFDLYVSEGLKKGCLLTSLVV